MGNVLQLLASGFGTKLALDPYTNKIYVANGRSNTVSIIDSDSGNVTNIPVGTSPTAIAIDPYTNKIYVANSGSDTVSVISASSDKVVSTIPVGTGPYHVGPIQIAVNGLGGKIYVANFDNNTISVISASSDKEVNRIPIEGFPSGITIGPSADKIYVANGCLGFGIGCTNTISVINSSSDKVIGTIPVGGNPSYIASDFSTDKIYVANSGSDTVSVINSSSDKVIGTIPVGGNPIAIAVYPYTNKIYVANYGSNTVSIIHSAGNVTNIPVGKFPSAIALGFTSKITGKIYVANSLSDTISVISASSDKVIGTIPVGYSPSAIIKSDVYPSIYYILNNPRTTNGTDTISVIDGSTDKVAAGVTFNIHPVNSGGVWCNNKDYPTNIYLYVASGTKCVARPNKDFEFSSWVENLGHNSTVPLNQSSISDSPWNSFLSIFGKPYDASATFDVNRFGTFTANFKAVPPPVPPEYWIPLYGIIVSTIVGWSIPSIIGWIKSKTQVGRANQFHKKIHSLYTDNNKLYENDKTLDTLRTAIKNAYAEGKISEQSYNNLKDETSILYERAYKKKIDSMNGQNNRIELDEIKNDITDAYAEGKITEQHYNLLKEKIANFSDMGQTNYSTHQRE